MDIGELPVDHNQNNVKLTCIVDKNDGCLDLKDHHTIIKKPSLDLSNCHEDLIDVVKDYQNLILPTGRRPFKRIKGLDYGLDASFVECSLEENIQDMSDDEKLDTKLHRYENYVNNSFVCDNGYLSENEIQTTPESNWKKKRTILIKSKNLSEKKRWKVRVNLLSGPEITTPGKGRKKPLNKWTAIVFETSPIPTGFSTQLSVEQAKLDLPQEQGLLNLHLEDEDYQDALDIVHKAMDLDTHDVPDCSAKIVPKTEVPDVIVEHDSNRQSNQDNIVHLSEDPTDSAGDCFMKYKIKYLVKEQVKHLMEGESSDLKSPELLYQSVLLLQPDLPNFPQHLIWKYINKYFFKYKMK